MNDVPNPTPKPPTDPYADREARIIYWRDYKLPLIRDSISLIIAAMIAVVATVLKWESPIPWGVVIALLGFPPWMRKAIPRISRITGGEGEEPEIPPPPPELNPNQSTNPQPETPNRETS